MQRYWDIADRALPVRNVLEALCYIRAVLCSLAGRGPAADAHGQRGTRGLPGRADGSGVWAARPRVTVMAVVVCAYGEFLWA